MPTSAEQFWLLTGAVPSGPFTSDQVRAELAAGRATGQTLVCPVGGGAWHPLAQTPGLGPPAPPRPAADAHSPEASAAPVAPARAPDEPAGSGRVTPPADAAPAPSPSAPAAARPEEQALQPTTNGPSASNRFWVLVGTDTTGPFRVSEIRAKVQSGELPPDAKARRVGTEVWVPLTDAVGALPPRPPVGPRAPADSPSVSAPALAPAVTAQAPDGRAEGVGVVLGLGVVVLVLGAVGYGGYWAYERLRPLTATEVCQRMEAARSAAEAKSYVTPRMHPILDAMFADTSAPDPNDTYEWTQEIDGPPAEHQVGRVQGYDVRPGGRAAGPHRDALRRGAGGRVEGGRRDRDRRRGRSAAPAGVARRRTPGRTRPAPGARRRPLPAEPEPPAGGGGPAVGSGHARVAAAPGG